MNIRSIAALLLDDLKTVKVQFERGSREYTYKTTLDLQKGDICVVQVDERFKIVAVTEVDTSPDIDIDSAFDYRWIVDKVDLELHAINMRREEAFLQGLLEARRKQVRVDAAKMLAGAIGVDEAAILDIKTKILSA